MAEYQTPNNSFASKGVPQTTTPERPKVEKVVEGKVTLKEKSKFEKVKEDGKSALKNVMTNTVAPSVKDLVLNTIWNWLSMIFFPDGSRRPTYSSPASRVSYYNSGYSNYGSYYDRAGNGTYKPKVVNMSEPAFKNPLMASISDANAVIDAMRGTIEQYGFATWSTLYDLCGMENANWQGANKYGWTSVESTTIATVYTADGQMAYELKMPRCSPIDDGP